MSEYSFIKETAVSFIKKTNNLKSKLAYQKLKKQIENKIVATKNFEEKNISLLEFDWQSVEMDRNWWWQLQSLPQLNWYVNCLEILNENEVKKYTEFCLKSILTWKRNASENASSPLAWHDHATAYRLRNISNWIVGVNLFDNELLGKKELKLIKELINDHLVWIDKEGNYSKNTNHGFDQSLIATQVSLILKVDNSKKSFILNKNRLIEEINFAFTNEGVHKENSPGYQKMMLERLKQLQIFSILGEEDIAQVGRGILSKAELFLQAITLSNGYLPLIGDTQSNTVGVKSSIEVSAEPLIYDYSKSGYFIIKGYISGKLPFTMIFKAAHASNYHRHDDDLMLYVEVAGETVISDSGLGSHDEKDSKRKYLRSKYAHSIPMLNRSVVRDKNFLRSEPVMLYDKKRKLIKAISKSFNVKIVREIDISKLNKGKIVVRDRCEKDVINQNWVLGDYQSISQEMFATEIFYNSSSLKFESDSSSSLKIISGWKESNFDDSCIRSDLYNNYIDATRIVYSGTRKMTETIININ